MKTATLDLRRLTLLAGALLIAAAAGAARAQDTAKPLLLVASPEMRAFYAHTVLVAVPAGSAGHLGFIVNRTTRFTMARLFPKHEASAKVVDPVYLGGPEMSDAIFAIKRSAERPSTEWAPLFGDLFVTANAEAVDHTIEHTPNDARYFAGFVAWRPGELGEEISKGFWHVADPEPGLVFRRDADGMWEELLQRLGNGAAPLRGMQSAALRLP